MNIFWWIFIVDIVLMAVFFLIGYLGKEKSFKDVWKGEKTMEIRKSEKLHKAWDKAHPILKFFEGFYYELRRKKDIPEDTYYGLKYFIQRGKKGYSRRDVWGFYCYLTKVLIGGLKDLQKMAHGCPGGPAFSHSIDLDEESEGTKEWKKIIGEMIWTFEAIQKIEDHEWVLVEDESKRKEYEEYVARLNAPDNEPLFPDLPPHTWHLMTEEEMKKYHRGWELFKQYYFDLWD